MTPQPPFIEPPDPFEADGPDGAHYRPGVPSDLPGPGPAAGAGGPPAGGEAPGGPPPPPPPPPPGGGDDAGDPGAGNRGSGGRLAVGEERMWATLIPLSTFLAPLLGPLVLWLIFKDQFPNVDQAGRETLNFQISLMIYSLVFGILALALIGLPFLMLLPVFGFICTVLAAYHASRGRIYRYPACIRFL